MQKKIIWALVNSSALEKYVDISMLELQSRFVQELTLIDKGDVEIKVKEFISLNYNQNTKSLLVKHKYGSFDFDIDLAEDYRIFVFLNKEFDISINKLEYVPHSRIKVNYVKEKISDFSVLINNMDIISDEELTKIKSHINVSTFVNSQDIVNKLITNQNIDNASYISMLCFMAKFIPRRYHDSLLDHMIYVKHSECVWSLKKLIYDICELFMGDIQNKSCLADCVRLSLIKHRIKNKQYDAGSKLNAISKCILSTIGMC